MWWQYVIVAAVLALVVYSFMVIVGYRTRLLTRKTDRTAESMYAEYGDSKRQQRKYAKEHGGEWRDDEGQSDEANEMQAPQ